MSKAILKQNIGAIKMSTTTGENGYIVVEEILEINTDMTIRELMQKVGNNDFRREPVERLKNSNGDTIYSYYSKDTSDSVKLKWMNPVKEEWDIEE